MKILSPKAGETVYDPACGTGGMLIEAIRYMNDDRATYGRIYGQEKNLATSAIARMNLFLHGAQDFKITQGDTLRSPITCIEVNCRHSTVLSPIHHSHSKIGAQMHLLPMYMAETCGARRVTRMPILLGCNTW